MVWHAGGDAWMTRLDAEPFGRWLRWQLNLRRMSQRQLAARSGVNHSTISRLIASDRQPSLATATKIARVLGDGGDAAFIGRHVAPSTGVDPVARVERALRADEGLSEEQVRRLMFQYLSERQSVARRELGHRDADPRERWWPDRLAPEDV
jgi:transcriptional regulator with XRE-family HTH domain